MSTRDFGKRQGVVSTALTFTTQNIEKEHLPKHHVALRIMLIQNWIPSGGLGSRRQGITVPIKADMRNARQEKRQDDNEIGHTGDKKIIKILQQLSDVWNQVEGCERDRGRNNIGFNTIFKEGNYEETEKGSALPQLPEVQLKINGMTTYCLVDTGSQITCVSHEFWESHLIDRKMYPIMPVTAMQNSRRYGTEEPMHIALGVNTLMFFRYKNKYTLFNNPQVN